MLYRFLIQDIFIFGNSQQIDGEMLRCIQKLSKNSHRIVVQYTEEQQELQKILQIYIQNNIAHCLQNIDFESMSQHSAVIPIFSFHDVSHTFPSGIHRIDKPWGYEEIWSHTDFYVAKCIYIKPHHRLSLQYHEQKTESIYVLEGTLYLWQDASSSPQIVTPNHFFHVPPYTIHRFGAKDQSVLLLEVSTTELQDVVRLEDDFGRHDNDPKMG